MLARVRRPTLLVCHRFHYKNFLDTLWLELKRTLKWLSVVVAMGAPERRAARPMVRLGMALMALKGTTDDDEYLVSMAATLLEDSEDSSARERPGIQSAALTSARPGLGSCA